MFSTIDLLSIVAIFRHINFEIKNLFIVYGFLVFLLNIQNGGQKSLRSEISNVNISLIP